ncbi:hypothetical protein EWM64_g7020 [Hericium alpestre]|uniref:Glycopeptide n=1 Tax=Hericium alpestre TaxID=135208 RepID=A0A4Y9ZQE0_9AGAM|nr:hypothetical protein EWM64_g7020 [Hericium alpestre]
MASTLVSIAFAAILTGAAAVNAESHTIRFDNQCGFGNATLVLDGTIQKLINNSYTKNDNISGIAYLQDGRCNFNGENCTLMEMTLENAHCPGCGSSTDISLISPHALNVPTAFSYYNGCDGQGAACNTPDCSTAFFKSDDNQVQVACEVDDVSTALPIVIMPNL